MRPASRVMLTAGTLALLACGSDSSAPINDGIETVFPAPNATDVSLNTSVRVTFADRFTAADNAPLVTLLQSGQPLPATMVRPDQTTEEWTPLNPLQPGQRYDVVVHRTVRAGTIDYTWSFTATGTALPAMNRAALMQHVERLAHDTMNGRGSATADELRAANYIAQQFQSFGLQPPAGAFLMQFPVNASVTSQNVIGVLPGTGNLQNEWIVVGAHYDHVGRRLVAPDRLETFNGADDNASGTAVVLELAAALSAYFQNGGVGSEPRRSLMFQAFGAEELGLIGSERYCASPVHPLNTVAAMLNFDMVGRLRERTLQIGGRPTAAEWPALLAQHNRDQLVLTSTDCAACTDHACFRRNGRPVLWFFTGFHTEYHQPGDDTPLINAEGLAQIADFAARITVDLAVRRRAPEFAGVN